jgi:hypothetical protein
MGKSVVPLWLETTSIASLLIGAICFVIVTIDVARNRQMMWIMNIVWPITTLYSGLLGLYAYYKVGRLSTRRKAMAAKRAGKMPPGKVKPFWQSVGIAATHCGSGCTLGDIIAEWLILAIPFTIFGKKIFGAWALDYGFAFVLGIAFQYFTIKPMKGLSPGKGLITALKADFLSLTFWQIGMYGWMAIGTFAIFGHELPKTGPVFWFMMQIAMLFGFVTSYPINWLLLKMKIKEKM